MRIRSSLLIVLFLVAANAMTVPFAGDAAAQSKQTVTIEGENLFMFLEFILVIAEEDGKVVVTLGPPDGTLTGEYKDIDIRKGDEIKMLNGKRVRTTAAIREVYEKLEIGDEIKLGVKRGDEMFMVAFPKADPEKMKGRMMIRTDVVEDGEETEED